MSEFAGRVVVAGVPHAVTVTVAMLGKVTVRVDGREALLGTPAKLRFGAGAMSSYASCELEVGGEVTRLPKPGESLAAQPTASGAAGSQRSHFLGGLGAVFAGYSLMMMFREAPPGRQIEFGLFQMATGGLGLLLLAIDWALHRTKG
jgi:hypothetical protein